MTSRAKFQRCWAMFPWVSVLWLTALWVLLWGELSFGNVVAGLVIGTVAAVFFHLPSVDFHGRVRPLGALILIARFLADLVVASVQVAILALSPGRVPRGAVIRVHLRSESDLYLTLTAELSSLVPGSLVVEAFRQTGMLYVHILDVDAMGGIEKNRRHVLAVERRVLRALASDSELEHAGLSRRNSKSSPVGGDG
ncbi:MAG: Na+/H+ antiporter subunit E [Acidimicrobiia bacterium]